MARFVSAAGHVLAGGIVLALLTVAGYRLRADATTMALLYLFGIVLLSLWASFVPSMCVAVAAILCLDYFFTEPLYAISISEMLDEVAVMVFAGTALVVSRLISTVRRSLHVRREQAGLLDLTHDSIFVRDMNGVITYWNRASEELYGWTARQAVGQASHTLLHTIFPMPLEEIMATVLRTGRWEGELLHTTKDGRQVTVASRWSLQPDSRGRPIATLETNNDITAHRRAQDTVREVQAELAHVARVTTMGEMAASIAHEVNQPLSGVVINGNACLRWLAGTPPNLDEAREAVQRIIRDGKRASDVIARIRNLSKKSGTEKEPVDLNEAIEEVLALAEGEIRRARVAIRTELARDVPPVLGDRVQLQQVVLNLVLNGIEAMSAVADRPRELVIRTEKDETDQVRVAVRDSGVGLDQQNMNRIFDAFYTTKRGGMGMGLSICRSIIENHGGRLWAIANDGPGTTFLFTV